MKVIHPFEELKKIIQNDNLVKSLSVDVSKLQTEDSKALNKKLLEYFKAILQYAQKNKVNLKKLYEDLYWLQYTFCEDELENKWDISYDVQQFFFEFQKNLLPSDLIKKIDKLMKKI